MGLLGGVFSGWNAYTIVNTAVLCLLPLLRLTPLVEVAFPGMPQEFDAAEKQILVFLGMVLVVKGRRVQTRDSFVSQAFMFSKIAIFFILWKNAAVSYMAAFAALCFGKSVTKVC